NRVMNQFCKMKGIKREFSVARTPQQNGVVKRKNRTLIEDARTMLADSKSLTTFWAEVVNIVCYVQNRVLVIKPHNKTPYELFLGLGYNAVPPPYTGNFMPLKPNLVYPSLDDFVDVNKSVNESVVEKPTVESNEPKTARKEDGAPIIKDWVFERVQLPSEKISKSAGGKTSLELLSEGTKFNLFSVSQMCNKKNSALFNDTACVVVSPNFKLTDESHVLLKVPRKDNMYSVDLKNVVPGGLTCLFTKSTSEESNLWHRRLGHTIKVKVIRCDNETESNNRVMNQFCKMKGIKREFSVARTPQQNGVVERKNRTLIEDARTMLADSKSPTTFWAEAVNIVCYVQNRVLVIKPHNKTPYELFLGRKPALSFMRPFRCPVTILNTIDHLGKFDGKADEGFFVRYSTNSKAFRVFNSITRIVEENLHVKCSVNTPNIVGSGPNWLFDIDAPTKSMNYKPVIAGNQYNGSAGIKASDNVGKTRVEIVPKKDYILLPLWTQDPLFSSSSKDFPFSCLVFSNIRTYTP
nr:retrovirus-related Pol polyprotein from transposon TNT 1-94 [Tanacetum cinerariifolium]